MRCAAAILVAAAFESSAAAAPAGVAAASPDTVAAAPDSPPPTVAAALPAAPPDSQPPVPPAPVPPPAAPPPRFAARNVPAWPVYVRWDSEPGRRVRVFGPVTVTSEAPGYRAVYPAFPVLGARSWEAGRREVRLAWPAVSWTSDPGLGERSLALATPLVGWRRVRHRGLDLTEVAPLYARARDRAGRELLTVRPFWHRVLDPRLDREERNLLAVPFFEETPLSVLRTWREADRHGWSAGLVFAGWEGPGRRGLLAPPWISYRESRANGDSARFATLFPLWLGSESARGASWSRTTWAGGLYYGHDAARGDSSRVRFRTVAPLWAAYDGPRAAWSAALPSWWSYRSATLRSSGLWPFWASFRRGAADSAARSGGSFAWPLVSWGSGPDYRALGVLPLWYRLRDGDLDAALAPPFYGRWTRGERSTSVWALVHLRHVAPGDTLSLWLNGYARRRPGETRAGIFPLWDRLRRADAAHDFVHPLWYGVDRPDWRLRALVPLWASASVRRDSLEARAVGPLAWWRSPGTRGALLFPVLGAGGGPGGSAWLVGPLFGRRDARGGRDLALVPVFWHHADARGWRFESIALTGARASRDGTSRAHVLGPLFRRDVRAPDHRTSSVLWWLWRDETRGTRRRTLLQPLWYYERRHRNDVYLSSLGGLLFSYERQGPWCELKVLFVPVRRWEGRVRPAP